MALPETVRAIEEHAAASVAVERAKDLERAKREQIASYELQIANIRNSLALERDRADQIQAQLDRLIATDVGVDAATAARVAAQAAMIVAVKDDPDPAAALVVVAEKSWWSKMLEGMGL